MKGGEWGKKINNKMIVGREGQELSPRPLFSSVMGNLDSRD